jgi:hypothetical protein
MGFRYFTNADFTNYGPQIGKVLNFKAKAVCNNISDQSILECMNFDFRAITMLEKDKTYWKNGLDKYLHDQRIDDLDSYVHPLIAIEPGKRKEFTLFIDLYIDPMSYTTIKWLKTIQLSIEYQVQQSDGIHTFKYTCTIPAQSVKETADNAIEEEIRERNKSFER